MAGDDHPNRIAQFLLKLSLYFVKFISCYKKYFAAAGIEEPI